MNKTPVRIVVPIVAVGRECLGGLSHKLKSVEDKYTCGVKAKARIVGFVKKGG